ncbi:MAG: YhfC family intramembrane metalloprotease, partial [Lachnospiraceae bacterium]|nr:YhfC family intramembrane metalloprotease [Lachnospiraceae bacterium]
TVIDQVIQKAPEQVDTVYAQAAQIAAFSFGDLAVGIVERIFAMLFHIGSSILVFYACRDKGKFWLYPLAILLHAVFDFFAALQLGKIITLSPWALEAVFAVVGVLVFCGAYFLLYKKDTE